MKQKLWQPGQRVRHALGVGTVVSGPHQDAEMRTNVPGHPGKGKQNAVYEVRLDIEPEETSEIEIGHLREE